MIKEIMFRVLILVTHIYAKAEFDIVGDFIKVLDWKVMSFTHFSSTQENAGSSRNLRTKHLPFSESEPSLPLVFKFKHGGLLL